MACAATINCARREREVGFRLSIVRGTTTLSLRTPPPRQRKRDITEERREKRGGRVSSGREKREHRITGEE